MVMRARSRFLALLLLPIVGGPTVRAQQAAPNSSDIVARGEYLARAGDCIACHTAPEGRMFAGGRAMLTPFGTLYSSNITPDPEAGIGNLDAEADSLARTGTGD